MPKSFKYYSSPSTPYNPTFVLGSIPTSIYVELGGTITWAYYGIKPHVYIHFIRKCWDENKIFPRPIMKH
jgi:hypothetical protein